MKGNSEWNFNLKLKSCKQNLICGEQEILHCLLVMILKSLGLSQLIYSSSILNIPEGFAHLVKTKLFKFFWKNKREKIKRSGRYQDLDKGGLRIIDIKIMFKALKLAWIPRLLSPGRQNWKTIPDYYLRKLGGLNFLLRCNYDPEHLNTLPSFYQSILKYFNELKNLYDFDQAQDLILSNNKEILVDGKTFFLRDWFNKGILSIQDLLDDAGHILSYQEFNNKYSCKSNFLQYYQVIRAIPKDLLNKAKLSDPTRKELYFTENFTIQLNESTQLVSNKAKTCDCYKLLNVKTHTAEHTRPKRWNENLSTMHMNEDSWKKSIYLHQKSMQRNQVKRISV